MTAVVGVLTRYTTAAHTRAALACKLPENVANVPVQHTIDGQAAAPPRSPCITAQPGHPRDDSRRPPWLTKSKVSARAHWLSGRSALQMKLLNRNPCASSTAAACRTCGFQIPLPTIQSSAAAVAISITSVQPTMLLCARCNAADGCHGLTHATRHPASLRTAPSTPDGRREVPR